MPSSRRAGDAQCAWWSRGHGGRWRLGALVLEDGRTAEERRAGLTCPVPSTPSWGGGGGVGGRGRGGGDASGDDIGRSANQAHGCARAATSADRRRSRARLPGQAGGGSERALRRPPSQPRTRLPASLHLLGFSRLLRASWGTLGTKTADPASPAADVARASVDPLGWTPDRWGWTRRT